MHRTVGNIAVFFGLFALAWGCGGTIEQPGQPSISKQQAQQLGKADWWDDLCEAYGWYGDGVCDEFCPQPDSDCLPPGHRPVCLQQGTEQEGWYWQDSGELIKQADCAGAGPTRCVAISSRSEGWASDEGGFIIYDPDCHRAMGIALWGESCGEDGPTCYQEGNLFCDGTGTCRSDGTCREDADCSLPGNDWSHARCIGYAVCRQDSCEWVCGQPPEPGPWSWTEMLLAAVESEHPYANDSERQWVVERQGASRIKLHFANIDIEPGYDWLLVEGSDGQQFVIDGQHQDMWTPAFGGDRLTVTLKSDSSVTGQGFVADRVAIYEQLPSGQCNRDEDCQAGRYCRPHQCINPYAPCHGDCLDSEPAGTGAACARDADCAEGLYCKNVVAGQGSCQQDNYCQPGTVEADCERLPHVMVPGHWQCLDNACVWDVEQPVQQVTFSAGDTPLDIPDADPAGVTSTIMVENLPDCADVVTEISVQIAHSYVGDLSIYLTGPDGGNVWLYDRQDGSGDDLHLLLNLDGVVDADEGEWTLHVADLAALDTGRLEAWSLEFTCR